MNDTHKPYNSAGVFTAPKSGTYTVTVNGSPCTVDLPAGHAINIKAFGNATVKLKESPMTKEERKTLNKCGKKKLIDRIAELKSSVQAYRDENSAKSDMICNYSDKLSRATRELNLKEVKIAELIVQVQQLKNVIKQLSQCL